MSFTSQPGFCPGCGTVLPMLGDIGGVKCFLCESEFGPEAFGSMESHYVIQFNRPNAYLGTGMEVEKSLKTETEAEGPIVERRCPSCGNEQMSYATLQLRSADEGQTVFYTCVRCKYKETENS